MTGSANKSFYIAKIIQVLDDEVKVIWYDTVDSGKYYGYGEFYLMKKVGNTLKDETVKIGSIICDFKSLTKDNKIPMSVLKKIDKNEHIKWKLNKNIK